MKKRTCERIGALLLSFVLLLPVLLSCAEDGGGVTEPTEVTDSQTESETLPQTEELTEGESETEESMTKPEIAYEYKSEVNEAILDTDYDPAYLLLVNKEHPLGESYLPAHLTLLSCKTTYRMELETRTAAALYEMLREMRADGLVTDGDSYDVAVTSAYRSYARQRELFDKYIAAEVASVGGFSADAYAALGETYLQNSYISKGLTELSEEDALRVVATYTAEAGKSEHQSGLCVDFITSDMKGLTVEFEGKAAFSWLSENAYRFGFILRYPKGKEEITGYTYEPWHYRFVGREAATEIYRAGITLEEYLLARAESN